MSKNINASDYLYFLTLFLSSWAMSSLVPLQDFGGLLFFWTIALIAFYKISKLEFTTKQFWFLVILVRLAFVATIPMISTDVFRFLWDGELLQLGLNPYDYTPDALVNHPELQSDYFKDLLLGMGWLSRDNHSCYPFMKQVFFWISTCFSDSLTLNVFVMRIILIAFDLGAIYFLKKLLTLFQQSKSKIIWFAFNPLLIVEFTGAMHFEGVLIFFLLSGIYGWLTQKWLIGSICFALAIQVKLIPLMFLPFLFFYAGWRKAFLSYFWIGLFVASTTLVWLKNYNLPNFIFSIQLYFGQFEFNAGIYMFFKLYSYHKYHYFRLVYFGKLLSKITFLGIIFLAFFRKLKSQQSFIEGMFFASLLYYFFVPIVHPWYITVPYTLGLLTRFNVGMIWCLIVPISYVHYQEKFNATYYVVVASEYLIVLGYLLYELRKNHSVLIR